MLGVTLTIKKLKQEENLSPSIREISQVLGFSSSQSGQRAVEEVMLKRLIFRDEHGNLVVLP